LKDFIPVGTKVGFWFDGTLRIGIVQPNAFKYYVKAGYVIMIVEPDKLVNLSNIVKYLYL